MALSLLDPYRKIDSHIHRLDARTKVIFTVGFVLVVNATPITAWPAHVAFFCLLLCLLGAGRIRLRSALARMALALPFVLMATLGLPFVKEGTVVASVSLPWGSLTMTDVGLLRFASVMVKSVLSLLAAVVLVSTTHFLEIASALRSFGVPAILTSVILLMYRYLFVLVEEAQRLMRAREARSGQADGVRSGGSFRWRARVTGRLIGTLFLRTYERSERIYQAMLARGYDGNVRALEQGSIRPHEAAFGGASLMVLVVVALLANYVW